MGKREKLMVRGSMLVMRCDLMHLSDCWNEVLAEHAENTLVDGYVTPSDN
jgi:hypothetical protein